MFSSRKLKRATYDSVALRDIAAKDQPDHDTIAMFRRRFLKEIEGLFVHVLLLAREMGAAAGIEPAEGRKLSALRKRTPEPVFGIIKAAPGVRQFSLRGLDTVRGEWSLGAW